MKSKPPHPEDYLVQVKEDPHCEAMYGPDYIQHIVDNHIPYCESGSKSDMECFVTHLNDPLCVVRGVAYTANPGEGNKKWAMDCKIRNLTTEIQQDTTGQKARDLEKFQDVEDFHEYFYWTGVRMQLEQWNIGHGSSAPNTQVNGMKCDAKNNDGKITLLVKRETNHNVWHKLMELWQAMVTLDAMEMAPWHPSGHLKLPNTPFLTAKERKNVQVVFEDDDVGPVEMLWPLVTGNPPIRASTLNDTCLGTVILPLPGSSSPFWDSHWQDRDCHTKFLLEPFLRRIYRTLNMETHKRLTENTVVTIIDRKGTRKIWHLAEHVEHLRKNYPDVTFNVVDFATIPLRDQIETVRNTDVLVGAMGAGFTHILFLPEDATVVELMTPGTHYSGFRNLAKMRGLPYFTSHGLEEEVWKKTQQQAPAPSPEQKTAVAGVVNAVPVPAPESQSQNNEVDWRTKVELKAAGEQVHAKQQANPQDVGGAGADAAAAAGAGAGSSAGTISKRHWQNDEFLYYTDEMFTALVAAGINGQLNRGLRSEDVKPLPHN